MSAVGFGLSETGKRVLTGHQITQHATSGVFVPLRKGGFPHVRKGGERERNATSERTSNRLEVGTKCGPGLRNLEVTSKIKTRVGLNRPATSGRLRRRLWTGERPTRINCRSAIILARCWADAASVNLLIMSRLLQQCVDRRTLRALRFERFVHAGQGADRRWYQHRRPTWPNGRRDGTNDPRPLYLV
jgi:hypothetical protein